MYIITDTGNGCEVETFISEKIFDSKKESLNGNQLAAVSRDELPTTPPDFWSVDNGSIVSDDTTYQELVDEDLDDRRAEACLAYQQSRKGGKCDSNFAGLLTDIGFAAQTSGYVPGPKALECLAWLQSLWDDEASRTDDNFDFSNNGKVPHRYKEVQNEGS